MMRFSKEENHMSSSKAEQEWSAYANSVKRRIANMREMLGMGQALPTANENVTVKEEGNAPGKPRPSGRPSARRPLGTIG